MNDLNSRNVLPSVREREIEGATILTVDARGLHEWLEVGSAFKDWIARRIEEYGFIDEKDFCSFLSESSGGHPAKEYALTLDMAKELSMVERNAKGKQARQYFIACERKAMSGPLVLDEATRAAIGGIVKSCARVVFHEELAGALKEALPAMVAAVLATRTVSIRHGKTAGQILAAHNYPRMKGLSRVAL